MSSGGMMNEHLLELFQSLDAFHNNQSLLNPTSMFTFNVSDAVRIILEMKVNDPWLSPGTEVLLILVYSGLMILGVLSNLLIGFIIVRKTLLRTPGNLFIVNLIVSDLTLCVICMPFTLMSIVRREWTLGRALCKLVPLLQGANIMVSTGTIAAIAVDRHCSIMSLTRQKHDKVRVVVAIVAIWVVSLTFALPVCFFQVVEQVSLTGEIILYEKCIEQWPSIVVKGLYTVGLLLIQYVLPMLVLFICHAKISSYLNVHLIASRDSPFQSQRAQKELRRNRRTTFLLSIIAVVFAISWLPMNVITLIADFYPQFASARNLYITFAVCHIIAMTSACTNPIMYGWLNTNIRREFVSLFRSCVRPIRTLSCSGSDRRTRTQNEAIVLLVFQANNVHSTLFPPHLTTPGESGIRSS